MLLPSVDYLTASQGVCDYLSNRWFLYVSTRCRAATIAISSMRYTDCAPIELPSFICMHSNCECCLSFQFADCGAMVILAPAGILSEYAGPLSAKKMSSNAWLLFLDDPSV